jgi:Fe-S cluster assembly iron-binding protein IscA
MPSEVMWALASSSVLVAATGVAGKAGRGRRAIGGVLRLLRWWLYDWWDYDRKRTKDLSRQERRTDMAGVTVTERAAGELRKALAEASSEAGQVLRIVAQPQEGGFALGPDEVREGDEVVEDGGETVLVIAPALAEVLEGAVIDVEETEEGSRLTIRR